MLALGLMSGTSLDGIDVAVLETDGETIQRFGARGFYPYSSSERLILKAALSEGKSLARASDRPQAVRDAEELITDLHIEAVEDFCAANAIPLDTVDVIGFHGQTILHKPESKLTVQVGHGKKLAEALGCKVVYDFRSQDVQAGGQGAPLVPVFHRAVAQTLQLPAPCGFINIGGVANITFIQPDGSMLACDTGPGNALIDDLVFARTGKSYDKDGALAFAGKANKAILDDALQHPFFARALPKSLDRNAFVAVQEKVAALSTEDAAATLTAFTAMALAACTRQLPAQPDLWIVAGGGVYNPAIMQALREVLPSPVHTLEEFNLRSDALEAQAFAFLAVRAMQQKPFTFPGTTGIAKPASGGIIVSAS